MSKCCEVEIMHRRLDLDRILGEEERIPCVFEESGAQGLGFLDSTGDHEHLHQGARVELPLWMALKLNERSYVQLELPKHYQKKMRDAIDAGAESINLKDFSPYYFEVGMKIAEALDDPDLKKTLRIAFCSKRFNNVMNRALCSSMEENTDFANDLTVHEAQIYYAGVKSAREVEQWRKHKASLIRKSGILNKRSYSSLGAKQGGDNFLKRK